MRLFSAPEIFIPRIWYDKPAPKTGTENGVD